MFPSVLLCHLRALPTNSTRIADRVAGCWLGNEKGNEVEAVGATHCDAAQLGVSHLSGRRCFKVLVRWVIESEERDEACQGGCECVESLLQAVPCACRTGNSAHRHSILSMDQGASVNNWKTQMELRDAVNCKIPMDH